ncbi:TRAP transporter small permease [Treponema sp. HNW]|uniref:TRAP transporter small permease n=1 Tax=Treponema sp. HNW TaxID=3116654 RepID=UPI003D0BD941
MKMFYKIKNIVEKIVDTIAVLFFVTVFAFALFQIIMRWSFNNPLSWSEESIRLMYVWICYLGWTIAARKNSHIRITAVIRKLPASGQRVLNIFNNLLVMLFSALMVVYGNQLTTKVARQTAVTVPFIKFSIVYVITPICCALIFIYQIMEIGEHWKHKDGIKEEETT